MNPPDQQMILSVLRELGITPADLYAVNGKPLAQAQAMMASLKETVRKNGKKLLFELHPDRTGNDPEKTERFKRIASVMQDIEKLNVHENPPPPPPQPVRPRTVFVVFRPAVGTTRVNMGRPPAPPGPQRPSPLHVVTLKPT